MKFSCDFLLRTDTIKNLDRITTKNEIEKRSRDANLLVNTRLFCKFLENVLFLESSSIYAKILQVASCSGAWAKTYYVNLSKREKRYMYRAIESESDVYRII